MHQSETKVSFSESWISWGLAAMTASQSRLGAILDSPIAGSPAQVDLSANSKYAKK